MTTGMIKELQKKFILAAMLAVTLLTAVFLVAINIINYVSVTSEVQRTMKLILSENAAGSPSEKPGSAPEGSLKSPESMAEGFPGEKPDEKPDRKPDAEEDAGASVGETAEGSSEKPETPERRSLNRERYFFVRLTAEGKIIYTDLSHISSLDKEEAGALVEAAAATGSDTGHVDGFIFRRQRDQASGGSVYSFLDEQQETDSLYRTMIITFIVGGVTWVLMLLLIIFLSRKAIRPIAENIERQKRFVTDAGHEIKTPLAIITANADVLELHMGENKWINNIRAQTVRLTELTQNMLTLSRMDEGVHKEAARTFDASSVLQEMLDSFEENLRIRNVALTKEIEPGVMLHFPEEAYRQLLSVLLENAVKYGSEGGELMAVLARKGKGAVLTVENTVDELPGVDPARLFDRFYRADEARSRTTGGSGIGLSVARAVAETGGGRIEAEYAGENRIRFTAHIHNVKG